MRRQHFPLPDPREHEVRRLKDELDAARRTILSLMPDAIRGELTSYYRCESREASHAWLEHLANQLIARVAPTQSSAWNEPRAYCPLCRTGPDTAYGGGFMVPEGLRRHLVGWGSTSQCEVTEAAWQLAREHWDRQWRESENEAKEAARNLTAERRRTEVLYRTRPDREPELRDAVFLVSPRVAGDWPAAEERLRSLGFSESLESNVKAYTREHDECLVYADPRGQGRIKFFVCPKPIPKRPSRGYRVRDFYLLDSWKNDLEAKYQLRLRGEQPEKG